MTAPQYSFKNMVSDLKCDLERYNKYCGYEQSTLFNNIATLFKCPVFLSIVNYRFGFWKGGQSRPTRCFCNMLHVMGTYLSIIFFKVYIECDSKIGAGLFLSRKGNIIIGVKMMGKNCSVFDRTTIGQGLGKGQDNLPEIGDNVCIDSGSIVYGRIKVGSSVKVNAFTVLAKSLPVRSVVGGNPARLLQRVTVS